MESVVQEIAHYVALTIELIAIAVIAMGVITALFGVARVGMHTANSRTERVVWMKFARWLVAGMTFQLAADIVNTSVAPTWNEVGRLAAIAAIRTFLSYFLDREMEEKIDLQKRGVDPA